MQCSAPTKAGGQCSRQAREGTEFCTYHLPDRDSDARICPSCRIRRRVAGPGEYTALPITNTQYRILEKAALQFDEQAPERFTAEEFVAWLRFDIPAFGKFQAVESDGAPPVGEGTKRNTIHRHPDPIPYAPIRRKVA